MVFSEQAAILLRLVLICLLVLSVHGHFIIEQPDASLLYQYCRWQWLQHGVCWEACLVWCSCSDMLLLHGMRVHAWTWLHEVYKTSFWLMHYGSPSPKRLQVRSTWPCIRQLDLGKLPRSEQIRLTTVTTSRLRLSLCKLACGLPSVILQWL